MINLHFLILTAADMDYDHTTWLFLNGAKG